MKTKLIFLSLLFSGLIFSQNNSQVSDDSPTNIILTGSFSRAYRIAKTQEGLSPLFDEYVKDLKSGISFDLSGYYIYNKERQRGIGLKYSFYNSKESLGPLLFTDNNTGNQFSANISDDINIVYFGPSYGSFKEVNSGKGILKFEISMGYMGYKNIAYGPDFIKITGSSFGMSTSLGYVLKLSNKVYFGPQLSMIGGNLKSLTLQDSYGNKEVIKLSEENSESLWRFDLSANLLVKL